MVAAERFPDGMRAVVRRSPTAPAGRESPAPANLAFLFGFGAEQQSESMLTAGSVAGDAISDRAWCLVPAGLRMAGRGKEAAMSTTRAPASDVVGAWLACWVTAAEIAWTAPLVVANRMVRVMGGGWPPGPREQRELRRMGEEKAAAFWEASLAGARLWPAVTAATVEATLRPVHRRVAANRRRLTRP
jgi:hypothetical protein